MFGGEHGKVFTGNYLCLRFGYLGVLGVTTASCLRFQSCLRNDGWGRGVGESSLGTSGLFETTREMHFSPEAKFPEHARRQEGCL